MKDGPESHVCAWSPLPSQIDHCSCCKAKDNSDMLSGRWSDTVDPTQGRGDCANR